MHTRRDLLCLLLFFNVCFCQPPRKQNTADDIELHGYISSQDKGWSFTCGACKFGLGQILSSTRGQDGLYSSLEGRLQSFCIFAPVSRQVCIGSINVLKDEIMYLIIELDFGAKEICGLIFPSQCPVLRSAWKRMWTIKMPPVPLYPWRKRKPVKNLKVLQISDIHIDMHYEEGGEADCGDPLCCRVSKKKSYLFTSRINLPAGKWGSYGKCDIPLRTFEHMLKHLASSKFDYIMWTGDLPAHDSWEQDRLKQLDLIQALTDILKAHFPNTPVYPTLGNHESFPVNSFPPSYIKGENGITWLYRKLVSLWSPWLTPEALETTGKYGYFTLVHRPGFRIISLNMNYCNNMNFWTMANPIDPDHQLRWLVEVLTLAEEADEKVHIIGHIPPALVDTGCIPVWRNNYYRIVNRYRDVITAQFFGHHHSDEIEIIYGDDQEEQEQRQNPIGVAYLAPSVTTHVGMNPAYRVYDVTPDDFLIDNHFTYFMNLSCANAVEDPKWEYLYDARSAYGLQSLKPFEWHQLVSDWSSDEPLRQESFNRYYSNFYHGNPPHSTCNEECRREIVCRIAVGNFTADC